MSDNVEPDYNLDHDLWQEDWAEQFRGNYETFINPLSIKAMQTELTRLRGENRELVGLLGRYVNAYPAFRIKPIGADGSVARIEQEMLTALEEKAQAALAKPASTAQSAASAVDHNKGSME